MFSIFKKKPLTQEQYHPLVEHNIKLIQAFNFCNMPYDEVEVHASLAAAHDIKFNSKQEVLDWLKKQILFQKRKEVNDNKLKSEFLQRDETKWLIEGIVNAIKESK